MLTTVTVLPDVGDSCRVYKHYEAFQLTEETIELIDVTMTREITGNALTISLAPENAKRLMMALASVLGYGANKEKPPKSARFTLE